MMQRLKTIGIACLVLALLGAFIYSPHAGQDPALKKQKLWTVLHSLGAPYPDYYTEDLLDTAYIRRGKEIFHQGRTTTLNGQRSSYQSIHYTCSSCHNDQIEDPDLRKSDPDARLQLAKKDSIPFLQGTTMYGSVNRSSWYNGDYDKKYGDLVKPARKDIRGAIRLCATECAQGRKLKDWEMTSLLAYFWNIQYTLKDLKLDPATLTLLAGAQQLSTKEKAKLQESLQAHYLNYSPATFSEVPKSKWEGYPVEGKLEDGKAIYRLSCMHCHEAKQAEASNYLVLDYSQLSFQYLKKHLARNNGKSIYTMIRKGTYAQYGHEPYMPHYPLERMSNQQVESLRLYIEQMAEGKQP